MTLLRWRLRERIGLNDASGGRAHLVLAAVLGAVGGAGMVLGRFPPGEYGFYPVCPIHAMTGLLCPGCGGTRALAALVHGDVVGAMRWNGLVVVALPVLAVWGWVAYRRKVAGMDGPEVPGWVVMGMVGVAGVFMVGRNII